MKKKNTVLYTLIYQLILLLSTLGVVLIIYLAVSILPELIKIIRSSKDVLHFSDMLFNDENLKSIGIKVIIIILTAMSEGVMFGFRIKIRHYTDFTAEGMHKKYSSYDRLSAKEKAQIDMQKLMDIERVLDSATLRQITHKGSKEPDKELDKLIGLNNVKKSVKEMAARMEYETKFKKKNKKVQPISSMHMCFLGPPGTGKTTVARIMTGILYKYKYIRKNQCIEIDGNFLKGNSPGETSKKTSLLIKKALGGVLFIDEAYALLEDTQEGYGQEAIATIVKEMEDNKDDIIIILAGYENEMKKLINSNPGLYSRIKIYLWFESYSIEELGMIFNFMANNEKFYVTLETLEKFKSLISKDIGKKNFGNARTVRNYLDKIIDKHAYNIINGNIDSKMLYTLCPGDVIIQQKEDIFI